MQCNFLLHRERVEEIYKPPQIADDEDLGSLLSQYTQDYRRMFVEHPRVRLDGVYIAVCHYMYVEFTHNISIYPVVSDNIITMQP